MGKGKLYIGFWLLFMCCSCNIQQWFEILGQSDTIYFEGSSFITNRIFYLSGKTLGKRSDSTFKLTATFLIERNTYNDEFTANLLEYPEKDCYILTKNEWYNVDSMMIPKYIQSRSIVYTGDFDYFQKTFEIYILKSSAGEFDLPRSTHGNNTTYFFYMNGITADGFEYYLTNTDQDYKLFCVIEDAFTNSHKVQISVDTSKLPSGFHWDANENSIYNEIGDIRISEFDTERYQTISNKIPVSGSVIELGEMKLPSDHTAYIGLNIGILTNDLAYCTGCGFFLKKVESPKVTLVLQTNAGGYIDAIPTGDCWVEYLSNVERAE